MLELRTPAPPPLLDTPTGESPGITQPLAVRRAGSNDAYAIATLFDSVYRDSSHPFRSVASVVEFLEDSRNFQILAEAGNRIVASMAMTYNSWNNSHELGRAITVPDFRRNGVARFLMQQVVDWVGDVASGDLIFGYPRVRRIAKLCTELNPMIIPVGHDAGRNVANARRETHLIVCGIPRYARFTHVAPPVSDLVEWRFLREQIYAPLGLSGSPGRYPGQCFVGAASRNTVRSGAWTFDYPAGDPSGALAVIGRELDGLGPGEISQELDEMLSGFQDVQHVTATVLGDNIQVIAALADRGFTVSAYLPAWYKHGQCRYDCVQVTRPQYHGMSSKQDFADLIGALQAEFEAGPLSHMPETRRKLAAFRQRNI
jgi:GNAT superfamily N-acetyltransferase